MYCSSVWVSQRRSKEAQIVSIAVSVFVDWLSLSNTESEANPKNNLMMRRAGLSRPKQSRTWDPTGPQTYNITVYLISFFQRYLWLVVFGFIEVEIWRITKHLEVLLVQPENLCSGINVVDFSSYYDLETRWKVWVFTCSHWNHTCIGSSPHFLLTEDYQRSFDWWSSYFIIYNDTMGN